ncbi:MAG: AEC family transporter, partial [Clostridiales bacterium]|nr:AEC family transporter [Clostridiales bacterium]
MLDSFGIAFNAVVPFLVYLALGFLIVRTRLADRQFMNELNKVTFRVLFPILMFYNIYHASARDMPSLKLILTAVLSILGLTALLLWAVPRIIPENPRRGVVIQGVFRSNYMLYGLPLALYVFGSENTGIAGIMVMIVVAVFNTLAVVVLELFHGEGRVNVRALPLKLIRNPLLQGCLLGLAFFLLGWRLPAFLEPPVSSLANMTTPLALITLGGTLQFS